MGGDHKCPVCDATFTRPQHVARHMRSHTGDRPYRCQFCPDQFARSDLLSRHVNKCHPAEKPPAGPPGRKGSRAALRAATSKQFCDQCVRSSLSCDGAKPCARCTQRNMRCTFVDFHRQTAPEGPGHPPGSHYSDDAFMSNYAASSASSSSSHLPLDSFAAFDTFHDTPPPFHSAFGVLSIDDPAAAPFFSNAHPLSDPNATPTWAQLINSSPPNPAPVPFQLRRRATSMFDVRTPVAVPQAFISPDHPLQQLDQLQRQPIQQPTYGLVPMPLPAEDLSSWSAKIQSQPPPELRLAPAKVKARRQTLSGGEPERERTSQLPHSVPALALPFRPSGPDGKVDAEHRNSASPVDPHTRSSSSSTASWEGIGIASESAMRPSFKRLPSATPLEHHRERKRVLISFPAGGEGVGSKIEDAVLMPLEHDDERKHVFVPYGSCSAEGVVPKNEDGDGADLGRFSAGPTHVVNFAEKRSSIDASGGGNMAFNLHFGTL